MSRTIISLAIFLLLWRSLPLSAAEPTIVQLWPGVAPGETSSTGEETITGKTGSRQVTNVSRPTLSVFRPAKEQNTGVAVIIAPGGGYRFLSWDHEGEDVAKWLDN